MQKQTIYKLQKPIRGDIKVPGDKSISHRSIILGSISQGLTEVSNFLTGEDCICTQKAFQSLGVNIESTGNKVSIQGQGLKNFSQAKEDIYLGNSGTAMRLLTGLFAGLPFTTKVTGDSSLSSRPMKRVIEPLSRMGACIESNDGKAPLIINPKNQATKLRAINYDSPIASAQIKSAILLAALNAEGITTVSEPSRSRDHLERMLQYFGADINIDGLKISLNGNQSLSKFQGKQIMVPNDISSAAFFLVLGAITNKSELCLVDVGINPSRTGILDALTMMQVDFELTNNREVNNEPIADIIVKSSSAQASIIGGDLIPRLIDEIPVLAVLAAQANGTTIIKDAEELRVKESDRVRTTVNLLRALGVQVEEREDGMVIEGRAGKVFEAPKTPWQELSLEHSYYVSDDKIVIDSHGDHRIAMSAAIAATHSNKPVEILQTEFVSTSFPGFFELIESLR